MRGRGRGRGRRSPSPDAPDEPSASTSNTPVPARVPPTGGVASLLRKNDYAVKNAGQPSKLKFKPTMVTRKPKVEELKQTPVASSSKAPAGRGKGRGRPLQEQTASGAFALGPMAASKRDRLAMGGGGGSRGSGGYGGSGGGSRMQGDDGDDPLGISSDEADMSDTNTVTRKVHTVSLADIRAEHPMAPLTLPRDQGNVLGEIQERLMASVAPLPQPNHPKIKSEPQDDDVVMTRESSTVTSGSSVMPIEDEKKKPIVVKAERVEESFSTDSSSEQLYMFQFPRTFPQFKSNLDASHINAMDVDEDEKKNVKPSLEGASSAYTPGAWQGWGKNHGRQGRDLTELNYEGQIGDLQIWDNGEVKVVLGDDTYQFKLDVMAASPTNFLQEVALHLTEPLTLPEGRAEPGVYVMGQVSKKFILRPDIGQLLTELEQRKRDQEALAALGKVKKEEEPDGPKTVNDLLEQAPAASKASAKATKAKRKPAA